MSRKKIFLILAELFFAAGFLIFQILDCVLTLHQVPDSFGHLAAVFDGSWDADSHSFSVNGPDPRLIFQSPEGRFRIFCWKCARRGQNKYRFRFFIPGTVFSGRKTVRYGMYSRETELSVLSFPPITGARSGWIFPKMRTFYRQNFSAISRFGWQKRFLPPGLWRCLCFLSIAGNGWPTEQTVPFIRDIPAGCFVEFGAAGAAFSLSPVLPVFWRTMSFAAWH